MVMLLAKSTNSKMSFVMVLCRCFGKATLKRFKSFLTNYNQLGLDIGTFIRRLLNLFYLGFMRTTSKTMPNTLLTVGQADSNSQTFMLVSTLSLSKGTSVSEGLLTTSTSYFMTSSYRADHQQRSNRIRRYYWI